MKTIYQKLLFLLLLLPFSVFAQSTLEGVVLDSKSKQPIPGVNVVVQGASTGTSTDLDGKFKLGKLKSGDKLVFSFIGYKNEIVNYTGQSSISVSLDEESNQIQEVVVQVGYGSVKKKDATGSVTTVTSKDFNKGPVVAADQMIQGKVAGLQVTSGGGAPGEGSLIRIRQGASLSANNDPLYVIDGVPVADGGINGGRNPLATINQNDIESVTVLKDASATAIYGFRASNGVIIINTKKGKTGDLKINYTGNLSYSLLDKKVDVLNPTQYRDYVTANGSAAQIALMGQANTDWQDKIFRSALGTDHNVSLSGGVENLTYRTSVGVTDMNGLLKRDNMNRATTSVALVGNFFDKHLKIELNNKTSAMKNNYSNRGAIGSALSFDPTQEVRNNDGSYFQWVTLNSSNNLAVRNPVSLIEQQNNLGTSFRSLGNIQTEYKLHFLPELKAVANFGYDYLTGRTYGNTSSNFAYVDAQGDSYETKKGSKNRLMDLYLNYRKDVSAIHGSVDFTAGYAYQNFNNYGSGYTLQGNGALEPDSPYNTDLNLQSFFARGIFNIYDKYLLTASLRRDASSRFAEDNRWGNFPAVALAWKLKNESFLKESNTISDLKLRLGWGKTGQQNVFGEYPSLPLFLYSDDQAQYQLGNTFIPTVRPQVNNPDLTWEKTETRNIGLDYALFSNKFKGSVDIYEKRTTDLLAYIPLAPFYGLSNFFYYNVGSMKNQGIELSGELTVVDNDNVNFSVGGNITFQNSKITGLIPGADEVGFSTGDQISTGNQVQQLQVGYAPNSFLVYEQAYGVDGKPIDGVFIDRNGDGNITEADKYMYKKPAADVFYGFFTNLTYKNWDMSMSWRGSWGNYLYNKVDSNLGWRDQVLINQNYLSNGVTNLLDTNFSYTGTERYQSDYYVQDASFIRLDNVTIGYNFKKFFGTKADAKLSLAGQNLLLFSPYKGIDPELTSGVDYTIYPRPKIFTLGLNVNF